MTKTGAACALLERRAIEAELLLRVYDAACDNVGEDSARQIIEQAVDSAAVSAGRLFALNAPEGGPSLAHFATVLERWREGGVLDIEDVRLEAETLSFRVTRCGYMARYAELGVPPGLCSVFSCRRDPAFAEGYSPHLRLELQNTMAAGSEFCRFVFRWRP